MLSGIGTMLSTVRWKMSDDQQGYAGQIGRNYPGYMAGAFHEAREG
jgi:hypothetical protein